MGRKISVDGEDLTFRRRLRLAHALKDFGVRVQYSVFECHLEPEGLEERR
jgi:CRISPR-associated endonuclease Cas2